MTEFKLCAFSAIQKSSYHHSRSRCPEYQRNQIFVVIFKLYIVEPEKYQHCVSADTLVPVYERVICN